MAPFAVHSVRFFDLEPRSVQCLAYSESLELLAVSRNDNSIELWRFSDNNPNLYLQRLIPGNQESSVEAVVWAGTDRNRLFSTGLHGLVLEHNLDTLSTKNKFAVTSGPAWCMDYNENKNRLAVGTEEGYVCLFEVNEASLGRGLIYDKVLDKQEGRILCLAWHSSGSFIVTGSADTLRVWDVASGHPLRRMTTGRTEKSRETIVWSVAFMNDFTIMSGDNRGRTSLWNGKMGTLIDSYQTHKADVLTVHVNASETIAYSSGVDPVIMHFQPVAARKGSSFRWVKSLHRWANTHDVRSILTVGRKRSFTISAGVDGDLVVNQGKNTIHYPPIPFGHNVRLARRARYIVFRYPEMLEVWRLGEANVDTKKSSSLPLTKQPIKLLQILTKDNETIRCCDISSNGQLIGYATPTRLRLYRLDCQQKQPKIQGLSSKMPRELELIHHMSFLAVKDDDDLSFSLLVGAESGAVQCLKIDDKFEVHLLFTLSRDEMGLSSGISHLKVNSASNLAVLADYNNNVVALDLHLQALVCKFPVYKPAAITSIGIHPKTSNVVVVYADQNIVEISSKTGKYTKYSNTSLSNLPKEWKEREFPVLGVLFETTKDELIILYDFQNICIIDKMTTEDEQRSSKVAKTSEKPEERKSLARAGVRITKKYKHLIFLDNLISDSELVAVEVKPDMIDTKLPPSLRQKKFGVM